MATSIMHCDVVKTITYKKKTFGFFQDQDHKNGMSISSLSLIAVFLHKQKKRAKYLWHIKRNKLTRCWILFPVVGYFC